MRKYNSRIITVEKGSFTPLVYTTFGGWARQATVYHQRLANKIAVRRNEDYSKVMDFMRTRISFSLLRSTLTAIRGDRGKSSMPKGSLSNLSFNLIPTAMQYESFWRVQKKTKSIVYYYFCKSESLTIRTKTARLASVVDIWSRWRTSPTWTLYLSAV